jgi:hypothetical protein
MIDLRKETNKDSYVIRMVLSSPVSSQEVNHVVDIRWWIIDAMQEKKTARA